MYDLVWADSGSFLPSSSNTMILVLIPGALTFGQVHSYILFAALFAVDAKCETISS